MEKEFFIHAVQMVEVEGSANIRTVLLYRPGNKVLIGSAAIEEADSPDQLNEDFKVDLGEIDPESKAPRTPFFTALGTPKSAAGLTADFLHEVIKHTRTWMTGRGLATAASILLAEPLALQDELVSAEWLSNYRSNLRRILIGKGFSSIDFLPEPFAVFQYYRYGARHPVIAQRAKHIALVIDFGGGTCDMCIIETTKEGDIREGGRNSKPLAAASKPIGGFFINRTIARDLFAAILGQSQSGRLGKGLDAYMVWRKGHQDLATYAPEYRNFIRNFHVGTFRVENPKLSLCRSIGDWRLDAQLPLTCTVPLPTDPFSGESPTLNVPLSATRLRQLFVDKVWGPHLKPLLRRTLERGKEDLSGAAVSVVLLSGGSANIGWFRELVQDEFGSGELRDAEILPLPDYQEVVAKGLALECARRFYNESGDFSSVTYNRLCLLLDPDGTGCETKSFSPRTPDLPQVHGTPGLLLPSASVLQNFLDKPMRWKVRLNRSPRHYLNYYFLRSSFDPDDVKNRHNIQEQAVQTPENCPFDASMHIELTVKEDGTARPVFIYKSGRTEAEAIVGKAKPFFLDMTSVSDASAKPEAYVGFDFGTSNTSVSFVDQQAVKIYQKRSEEKQWRELSDLVDILPFPLAAPLARYLGQTDVERLVDSAFEFVEAALALGAYVTYLEFCSLKGRGSTKLFRGLTQRSAGPLWHFLLDCLNQIGSAGTLSVPYRVLLDSAEHMSPQGRHLGSRDAGEQLFNQLDEAVNAWAKLKHKKIDHASLDHLRPVRVLANLSHQVFSDNVFGFLEKVQKQRFGRLFQGTLRHAHGKPPFIRTSTYEGNDPFSDGEAVLVSIGSGQIFFLQPLVYWDACIRHPDIDPPGHCYVYDAPSKTGREFSYKAAGCLCSQDVSLEDKCRPLAEQLMEMREADPHIQTARGQFREG
jgi:hypothetical protein